MSVASDLNSRKAKLQTILQNTNAEIAAKGGSSASTIASIPAAVASIAGGAELKEVTITPNGQQIVALPEEGYDGFSKVTVSGDANLVAANIKAGVTIYGVTGTMSGGSEADILVPTDYQSYVATAKTLYTGDYAGLIILDSGANTVAVCFMMDDFSIESYNESSTWFSMTGAYYCRYAKDADTWEQLDYRTSVSTGEHYGNHIKFATRTLFCGGIQVWPRESSGGSFSGEIVPWSTGTDEQIAAMVAALDAGTLSVEGTGWAVGDERTVHLSAMDATGVGESHAAQDVVLVLGNVGGKFFEDGTECHFVVLQKDSLNEAGYMNSSNTNSGGWEGCARRAWCNDVYSAAIPAALLPIFKRFKNISGVGGGASSGTQETVDLFALAGEGEIFGSRTYAFADEVSAETQFEWYKTSANRVKKRSGSANYWWERSAYSGHSSRFCCVSSSGHANLNSAYSTSGLAPFGCI